ncbi:hypothetical protein Tsubulata_031357 [Turnera subulata]|uniref:Protein kinase domain-containing protein n=1 Tax=Turnera subulata TaxID=218843 RepID=A0A9Q0JC52_9ROSI|nr:hypothetical protein Tsubulata_031357 [Turnera subulata]
MAARYTLLFMTITIQLCLLLLVLLLPPYVHSVTFDIPRFEQGSNDIYYEGDAFPSVGAIDLTMDYYYRVGKATYAKPVHLWDSSSGQLTDFTTHFTFKIDILNYTTYGHGIAFFLAPVGYQIPPNSGGGFLGLLNTTNMASLSTNQLVMVEFDSFANPWDPKVRGKIKHGSKIYLLVGFPVCFVLILGGLVGWFVLKKRITTNNGREGNKIGVDLEKGALPRKFTYQELSLATNGFADSRRLGQGGSGLVYRGTLTDLGRMVAVKRVFTGSEHPESLFINEVKIISRLIHRNLVQFLGWCHERGEFLLVYEYMPNGSLDTHLFGNNSRHLLPWNFRYNIALGLASALHYLHEGVDQCVLHRDLKPANILLDMDFTARLGDFGIAKLVDTQLVSATTYPAGTPGYVAPEYQKDGKPNKSTDIFSFGVVALEIACGRRNGRSAELVKEVWSLYREGNILDAADDRLDTKFDTEEMTCLMMVGLWCTHPVADRRPSTGQVIQFLKFEAAVPELPSITHDGPVIPVLTQLSLDSVTHDHGLFRYATG